MISFFLVVEGHAHVKLQIKRKHKTTKITNCKHKKKGSRTDKPRDQSLTPVSAIERRVSCVHDKGKRNNCRRCFPHHQSLMAIAPHLGEEVNAPFTLAIQIMHAHPPLLKQKKYEREKIFELFYGQK